jgi:S-methylmethionine-dependent homocysteine/selenocysteine methylase
MVISGNIGPRGDGYQPGAMMSADEAEAYHAAQIGAFRETAADMVSAFTMNYAGEAVGIARAAKDASLPVVLSLTVETDGRLPTGQSIAEAIAQIDSETGAAPVYYMLNCAHPAHFAGVLPEDAPWTLRLRGVRANASQRSHAELDQATDLDAGDPVEFGRQHAELRRRHRHINVLGGCCGTDHRHVEQIRFACEPAA